MPQLSKTLIKLAAKFVELQGKRILGERFLVEVGKELTEYAGESVIEKLNAFFDQGERAEKLLAAFTAADDCFATRSETYAQLIRSQPLRAIESLEKLANALPELVDHAGLLYALRRQFRRDWQNALTDPQAERAAGVYADCLVRAFAIQFEQDLPLLIHIADQLDRIEATTSETLETLNRIETRVTGASAWRRPAAPRADAGFVGRKTEMDAVTRLLAPGTRAAIIATVHGTPGIGKTWLARHLAAELEPQFPGGVIFQPLGSTHQLADQCTPILDDWGKRAGYPLADKQHLSPDEVRGWLAGHGEMLIVLDDIWNADAVQPLLRAAPNGACVLLTSRNRKLARAMSDQTFSLDLLSPDDALTLLRARVEKANNADEPLLQTLANALERHAMALGIAGASLDRLQKSQWKRAVSEIARQVREGSGFGDIQMPGDEEKESRVEAALKFSYDDLTEIGRTRFRALGAFAADASFRTQATAGIWDCAEDDARGQLTDFYERGLLTARDDERWQQHLLLRDYALALLNRAGETNTARERHAAIHLAFMREADDKQIYHLMLPDYPQLRVAFEWAMAHNTNLAQGLAANTENLQAQFGFVRDSEDWSRRLLELARKINDEQVLAQALLTRGNALSRVATLPGEDRAARLRESLAAYDEALRFRRPDTAPLDYAMTQFNLAILAMNLAELPGENQRARWRDAIRYAYTARAVFIQQQHVPYERQAVNLLRWIAEQCGESFPELWKELNLDDLPGWGSIQS